MKRVRVEPAAPATPRELGYRMPAEWAPHNATWLAWPHKESDFPGKLPTVKWVVTEVVSQLVEGERVRLIVEGAPGEKEARSALAQSGVPLARVDFVRLPTDRSWTRDSLPSFVLRQVGRNRAQLGAVKFRFNGWGRYPDHRLDNRAGEQVARWLAAPCFLPHARVAGRRQRVVLEGGAIDVDGEGTLLATKQCLLTGSTARNPKLGVEGTERVLSDNLGIDKVLWVEDGIAGDDTAGHVDDFVRFVSPGRIVLARETRARDPNYRALNRARESLTGARDARGRKLEIVDLPMPRPRFFAGQRLPASYANFYIANGLVLVPTFNDESDRVVLGLLSELFPERRVVGIHCVDLVLGLGTLHCSTQQEPASRPTSAHRKGHTFPKLGRGRLPRS